jgi:hypothetical protein
MSYNDTCAIARSLKRGFIYALITGYRVEPLYYYSPEAVQSAYNAYKRIGPCYIELLGVNPKREDV